MHDLVRLETYQNKDDRFKISSIEGKTCLMSCIRLAHYLEGNFMKTVMNLFFLNQQWKDVVASQETIHIKDKKKV